MTFRLFSKIYPHTHFHSGQPMDCTLKDSLSFPHVGETRMVEGQELHFRAEVGLLSRNIVIQGDHDETLCPNADLADDGLTQLSCNQFGAQIFMHSPGHESLIVRIANLELANGGQAFRLGRRTVGGGGGRAGVALVL